MNRDRSSCLRRVSGHKCSNFIEARATLSVDNRRFGSRRTGVAGAGVKGANHCNLRGILDLSHRGVPPLPVSRSCGACPSTRRKSSLCAVGAVPPLRSTSPNTRRPVCYASHTAEWTHLQQCVSHGLHRLHGVLLRDEIFQNALALLRCEFSTCLSRVDQHHVVAISLLQHLKEKVSTQTSVLFMRRHQHRAVHS